MKLTRFQKAGRKGGRATSRNHSADHYQKIGEKGGIMCRTLHGSAFYGHIRRKAK